jgi:DNA mismatch endonuclease (patch repair protein)
MSRIRGKGNESTEVVLARLLRAAGISEWRRTLPIRGRPDFSFQKKKVAMFVDGCFWHGCPVCFRLPRRNRKYWKTTSQKNRRRDRLAGRALKRCGWYTIRIKECQLKNPQLVILKIQMNLTNNGKKSAGKQSEDLKKRKKTSTF